MKVKSTAFFNRNNDAIIILMSLNFRCWQLGFITFYGEHHFQICINILCFGIVIYYPDKK